MIRDLVFVGAYLGVRERTPTNVNQDIDGSRYQLQLSSSRIDWSSDK